MMPNSTSVFANFPINKNYLVLVNNTDSYTLLMEIMPKWVWSESLIGAAFNSLPTHGMIHNMASWEIPFCTNFIPYFSVWHIGLLQVISHEKKARICWLIFYFSLFHFILFMQIPALSSRKEIQYSNSCFRDIIGIGVKDIMNIEELRQRAK